MRALPARASVIVALLAHISLAAQEPQQPTFRTETHLIVQTVSVKDKNGKPIQGLTVKDFIVTENGLPQAIAFVEYQALDDAVAAPSEPTAAPPTSTVPSVTAPAVSVPVPGDTKYRGRRLLVLYFDLANMPQNDQLRVFAHADRYISSRMSPADMVAIMVFQRSRVTLKQDFTDNRATLRAVIDELINAADNGERGALADAGGAFGEDDDTFNMFATDRQLAALQTAVTDLGPLPEMKTLVYFGSGLRLNGADNQAQLRATVNAAVRSNVTINPIDTRGLVATPPLGDATKASPAGIGAFTGSLAQRALIRQQQSQDSYYALAKDTGGRALFDNNDLTIGIVQAAQAVTGYYMIGYYSTNVVKDGKFRRVKVSVAESLNAEVAYRPGYYGAKEFARFTVADKERQLEEALKLEDPITDIPMAVEVNYFQISSAEYFVPVSVRMPGSELTRPRPTGTTTAIIDMIGEIKDQYGVTLRNARDKLGYKLDAATAAQVARQPIQYESGFTLLPGSYVIKVLARDATTGRIGTFQQPFVVPNLERETERLPTSTVVLATQRVLPTDALYTVKQKTSATVANPLVYDGLKLIPSVTRTFSARVPIFVFLQAYERDAATMRPLVAFAAFYRDGVKAFETEPVGLEVWDPKTKAVPIRLTIPAGQLAPGEYDCQVSVLDPAGNRAAFWRASVRIVQ